MVTETNLRAAAQSLQPLSRKGRGKERAAGATALAASSGAVAACASCCVLPLAFPALVLAGAGGTLAWMADAYSWIIAAAGLLVAAGWVIVGWQSRRARRRPEPGTTYMLIGSTMLLVLALLWPGIEPALVTALR